MNQKKSQITQSFKTNLSTKEFEEISIKIIEELELKVNYKDTGLRSIVFSKTLNLYLFEIDLITIKFVYKGDKIEAFNITSSQILTSRNKQLNLIQTLIERFKNTEINYSKSSKKEKNFEESFPNFESWAEYQIPDKLPPMKTVEKRFTPVIIASIITAIFVGFFWAFFSVKTVSIIPLYEMIASFLIIFVMNKGIRKSNYTKYIPIKILLLGTIIVALFLNEYFQFLYYKSPTGQETLLSFIEMKLNKKIVIDDIHYQGAGLKVLLLIRILFIYWIANIFLNITIKFNEFKHIPAEVDDFITYNLLLGKTDSEVKNILAEKGWNKSEDQNEVLKAME